MQQSLPPERVTGLRALIGILNEAVVEQAT
jgi:hypothetical protein